MKETMKRLLEVFLICHFVISMMIGLCGLFLAPEDPLGYEDLFDPALMAFLCTLPTLLTVRTEKLTMKQMVLRKILQILLAEGIVLALLHFGVYGIHEMGQVLVIAAAVLLVFAGVSLIDWVIGYLEAEELNRRLAQMKRGYPAKE